MTIVIMQSARHVDAAVAIKRLRLTSEPAHTCRQSLTEGAASFGPENDFWLDMYTIDRRIVAQTSGTVMKHACTRSGTSRSSPNTSHSLQVLTLCVLPETGRTWVIHLGRLLVPVRFSSAFSACNIIAQLHLTTAHLSEPELHPSVSHSGVKHFLAFGVKSPRGNFAISQVSLI